MSKYLMQVSVQDGELESIMKELSDAQEKIYECYKRLENLGVLTIKKEKAVSGN